MYGCFVGTALLVMIIMNLWVRWSNSRSILLFSMCRMIQLDFSDHVSFFNGFRCSDGVCAVEILCRLSLAHSLPREWLCKHEDTSESFYAESLDLSRSPNTAKKDDLNPSSRDTRHVFDRTNTESDEPRMLPISSHHQYTTKIYFPPALPSPFKPSTKRRPITTT